MLTRLIVLSSCLSLVLTATNADAIVFADGQVHVIDASNSFPLEEVIVRDGPDGTVTTLLVVEGGAIGASGSRQNLQLFGNSVARVSGGRVGSFHPAAIIADDARLFLEGGTIGGVIVGDGPGTPLFEMSGGFLGVLAAPRGDATPQIRISGGSIFNNFLVRNGSIEISGGNLDVIVQISDADFEISGGFLRSQVFLNSLARGAIQGGFVDGEIFTFDADVEIRGGVFQDDLRARGESLVTLSGGLLFGRIDAEDESRITIIGRNFNLPLGELPFSFGRLTGELADGSRLNNLFGIDLGAAIELVPALLHVDADIRPGTDVNPVNPMSRGIIPVAILGSERFDVTEIDRATLAFGPDNAEPLFPLRESYRDVNRDGFVDLVSHFRTEETGIAPGDTEACLSGETLDATPFQGCDAIRTMLD